MMLKIKSPYNENKSFLLNALSDYKKDLLTEHESNRVNGNEILEKKMLWKETHIYIFIKN